MKTLKSLVVVMLLVGLIVGTASFAQAETRRCFQYDGKTIMAVYQILPDGTTHVLYWRDDNSNEYLGKQVIDKNGEVILDTLKIRLPKSW